MRDGKESRKIPVILLCVLFLAADACLAGILVKNVTSRKTGGTVTMGEEERLQMLGEGMRNVTISSHCCEENGTAAVMFMSKPENPLNVSAELKIAETGNVIANIGVVEPGWYVKEVQLTGEMQSLHEGENKCVAVLHFYLPQTNEEIGTAARQISIYSEN